MILRRTFAATIPAFMVVGVVTACSSVPDITFDDDATASDADPNVLPDGGRLDGSDAPADVAVDPNCVRSGSEVCDDGLDNDCNGLVDCADPSCQPNFECVDRAPPGFELLGVADTQQVCPPAYTDPADLEMLVGANAACECSCLENGGSCTAGTAEVTVSTDGACAGGVTTTRSLLRTQATCAALPGGKIDVGSNNSRNERALAATAPTSCQPEIAIKLPAQLSGRTCKPPAPTGGGCPPTQVCVRRPTAGFALCVGKPNGDAGSPSCVAPYLTKRRAGGSVTSIPTCDVADCSCNGPTACTGSVTLYETANCSTAAGGKSEEIAADGTCRAMTVTGGAWSALAYRATSSGGCAPVGTPVPQGTLDLANEETICCK